MVVGSALAAPPEIGGSETGWGSWRSGRPQVSDEVSIVAARRGYPWVSMSDGRALRTSLDGDALSAGKLRQEARPLSLAAGDLDEDGVPDLAAGYRTATGGLVILHRGNIDAIYPNSPQAKARRQDGTFTPAPFLSPARAVALPAAPDLLQIADLDGDGHLDLLAVKLGHTAVYFLPGDGSGALGEAVERSLGGSVTAVTVGDINRRDGLADLVVAVSSSDGARLLVFEGPYGALHSLPEVIPLPAPATALALGHLDEHWAVDLAAACGEVLVVVRGRDRRLVRDAALPPRGEWLGLPFVIEALAIGDFVREEQYGLEIALLSDTDEVHLLEGHGNATEGSANVAKILSLPPRGLSGAEDGGRQMVAVRLSSLPAADLLVLDPANRQLHLLITDRQVPRKVAWAQDPALESLLESGVSFDATSSPVAMLPMRLNSDALDDLVILAEAQPGPVVVTTLPASTIFVDSAGNEPDCDLFDGVCAVDEGGSCTGPCTLRAAIEHSNQIAGADAIHFAIPGTGIQTIPTTTASANQAVTIDGTTQPGYAGTPLINVSRGMITLNGGSSTVRGIAIISRAELVALVLDGDGDMVEGCYIGIGAAPSGSSGSEGIRVTGNNSQIGGRTANARNVISKNVYYYGLHLMGVSTTVEGNYIGTDPSGSVADVGNWGGVFVEDPAASNTIGGTLSGAENLVAGNVLEAGIILSDSAGATLIQGNLIGTDPSGSQAQANRLGIVLDYATATVGGTVPAARNLISGNLEYGIRIENGATNNDVLGNYIGTDTSGTAGLGNGLGGVLLDDVSSNTVDANLIAHNQGSGVVQTTGGTGNTIRGNAFFANTGLGIDLGNDGVTANDAGDPDLGPNNLQNFPVVTEATSSSIDGTLNSLAGSTFGVDLFWSSACDPSGHGEAESLLATTDVTTDGSGDGSFVVSFPPTVPVGEIITATATGPDGSTSELSACTEVINEAVRSDGAPILLSGKGGETAVAATEDGDGVVVWQDDRSAQQPAGELPRARVGGIVGRRINPTGSCIGEQFEVSVPSAGDETPTVAMDEYGRIVVVWRATGPSGGIFARLFEADASPRGDQFLVSDSGVEDELPAVAADAAGRFLVAWRRVVAATSSVHGRFYDSSGTPNGSSFQVDSGTGTVSLPAVAMNGAGAGIVVFAAGNVQAQRYDAQGNGVGGLLSLTGSGEDADPTVGMAADGSFVATWDRLGQSLLRRFDAAGSPVTAEIEVNTAATGEHRKPWLAMREAGDLVVVWESLLGGIPSVRGRVFDEYAQPLGDEYVIATGGPVPPYPVPGEPRAALGARLFVSYSLELSGVEAGSYLQTYTEVKIFSDGFESSDTSHWTLDVP